MKIYNLQMNKQKGADIFGEEISKVLYVFL